MTATPQVDDGLKSIQPSLVTSLGTRFDEDGPERERVDHLRDTRLVDALGCDPEPTRRNHLDLCQLQKHTGGPMNPEARAAVINVVLTGIGTASQAVIQAASDPAALVVHPWLPSLSVLAAAFAGHELNRLASRVDQSVQRRSATVTLLTNEHLARAQAVAIQQRLLAVAAAHPDARELRSLARDADEWWTHLARTGITATDRASENEMARRIAEHMTGRESQAPKMSDWAHVLDVAADSGYPRLRMDLRQAASEGLALHFVPDSVEALKLDLAHDGQAFGRVALSFFSEIFVGIQDLLRESAQHGRREDETVASVNRLTQRVAALSDILGAAAAHQPEVLQLLDQGFGAVAGGMSDVKSSLDDIRSRLPDGPQNGSLKPPPLLTIPLKDWNPSVHSPARLLRADCVAAVPFHGRQRELEELEVWATRDAPVAIQLCTGRGGIGKTRLFIKFCELMHARGWLSGFLDARQSALTEAMARLMQQSDAPLLIVVDYAETHSRDIGRLVAMAAGRDRAAIRLVFLARSTGDWWEHLKHQGADARDVLAGPATRWTSVRPLTSTAAERVESFQIAATAFADRLGKARPQEVPESLAGEEYSSTLVLHMRALAAAEGRTIPGERAILDYVLDREKAFWCEKLERLSLSSGLVPSVALAMGTITLAGGAVDDVAARRVLRTVPSLADQQELVLEQLSQLLHETYPGEAMWVEPLQPDTLGEHLAQSITQNPAERARRFVHLLGPADGSDGATS